MATPKASALDTIAQTISREFADIADLEQVTRLLLAALLGGVLGFQRESSGKSADLRTAMGAAMFVTTVQFIGVDASETSRVIQGVIASVGFLGARAIMKSSTYGKEQVKGLTTATGIWFNTAIGVAVGVGKEFAELISTVVAPIVLAVGPLLTRHK